MFGSLFILTQKILKYISLEFFLDLHLHAKNKQNLTENLKSRVGIKFSIASNIFFQTITTSYFHLYL